MGSKSDIRVDKDSPLKFKADNVSGWAVDETRWTFFSEPVSFFYRGLTAMLQKKNNTDLNWKATKEQKSGILLLRTGNRIQHHLHPSLEFAPTYLADAIYSLALRL